jgi:hypothetical protein
MVFNATVKYISNYISQFYWWRKPE